MAGNRLNLKKYLLPIYRSESFANDAQILKNLQEIKMQKAAHISDFSSKNVNNLRLGNSNSSVPHHPINKQTFLKKNNKGLQKLKEYPKCESQNSSIETLPSSGTGNVVFFLMI